MKKKTIKLVLKKTRIARINNLVTIKGGTDDTLVPDTSDNTFFNTCNYSPPPFPPTGPPTASPPLPETATPGCLDSVVVCYQDTMPVFG